MPAAGEESGCEVALLLLPVPIHAVEEEDEALVVTPVCSAEPAVLHGGVSSATLPLCLLSAGFREERGTEEGNGGGGGEGEGWGARVSERRRGAAYMEGKRRRGAELAVAEGALPRLLSAWCYRRKTSAGTTGVRAVWACYARGW